MLRRPPTAGQEARGAGARLVLQLEVLEGRRIPEAGNAARAFVGHPRPYAPDEGLLEERDGDDLVAHHDALDVVHHRLALLHVELPRLPRVEIVHLGKRSVSVHAVAGGVRLASVHDSARLGVMSPAGMGLSMASWTAYMTM